MFNITEILPESMHGIDIFIEEKLTQIEITVANLDMFEFTLSFCVTLAIIHMFNWAFDKIFYSQKKEEEKEAELGQVGGQKKKTEKKFSLEQICTVRAQCQEILVMFETKEMLEEKRKTMVQSFYLENYQKALKQAFKLLKTEVKNIKMQKNSSTKNEDQERLEDDIEAQIMSMKEHEKQYMYKLLTTLDEKDCVN